MQGSNPQTTGATSPTPLSPADERTWAMAAHLSIVANLVTGILGTVAALVIYLVFRDRSQYVAYQALQATVFQLISWVGAGLTAIVLWIVAGVLTLVCVGVLLYPLAAAVSLIPFCAIIYGIIGAVSTSRGEDFRYWLIGDWIRSAMTGTGNNI